MKHITRQIIHATIALAAAGKATGSAGAPAADVAAPAFEIESGIAMPAKRTGGRTGTTIYPFDKLEVGQSFFVAGKTAKKMASTVSSANKRNRIQAKNDDGSDKVTVTDIKDASGTVTGQTRTPVMVANKHFAAYDTTKDDPKGAGGCRVFRYK